MDFVEQHDTQALVGHAVRRSNNARVWHAKAPDGKSLFQIVCLPLVELELRAKGIVNFLPGQEPKGGRLIYMAQWIRDGVAPGAPLRLAPIVGNFHGGFETYKEAEQICEDVWKAKGRPQ